MDREQYLRELEARLSNRMPPQELLNVMRYYTEYFDEAGPEGASGVMLDLGSPGDLTGRILGETVVSTAGPDPSGGEAWREPPRRGLRSVWGVLLAIFAAPIAIPLAVGLFVLALGILAAIFALFLGLGAAGVLCVAMGVLSAVCGFTAVLTGGVATTMYFVGGGMLVAGFGALLLAGGFAVTGVCLRGLGGLMGRLLHRRGDRA